MIYMYLQWIVLIYANVLQVFQIFLQMSSSQICLKKKIGGKMVHVYYTGFYQKYKPDKFVTWTKKHALCGYLR